MNISKKSWHYRLLSGMDFKIPNTLCGYFWKTAFTLALLTLFSFAILWFFFGIGFTGMEGPLTWMYVVIGVARSLAISLSAVAALFILMYILIADMRKMIHGWIYDRFPKAWRKHRDYDDYTYDKREKMSEAKKAKLAYRKEHPNMLIEFLKAKKQKVCPFLVFKD